MIQRLLRRLNRVFNKDPQAVDLALSIAGTGSVAIAGTTMILTTSLGNGTVDLSTITLSQLPQAVSTAIGCLLADVTLDVPAGMESLLARGLLSFPETPLPADLQYPRSILYNEMQTYAWLLEEQAERVAAAERQLYFDQADGKWLDYWGNDHYGVPRYNGESDSAYITRVIYQVTRPTQNNIALAQIVKDALGVDVVIRDAVPNISEVPPADQAKAPGRFLLDMGLPADMTVEDATILVDRIKDIVRKYKAAGTDFLEVPLRKLQQPNETLVISESVMVTPKAAITETFVAGPLVAGAGWRAAAPGVIAGGTTPKEQAFVTVILASNSSVVSQQLLGG